MDNNYNYEFWRMMEPMKYYDKRREDLSDNLKKKYDAMVNNENNEFIASCNGTENGRCLLNGIIIFLSVLVH